MFRQKEEKIPIIHIALLGSSGVGKSSICSRYVNSQFEYIHDQTGDIDTYRKLVDLTNGNERKQYCILEIDDTFPINHPDLIEDPPNEYKKTIHDAMERKLDKILANGKIEKTEQKGNHPVYLKRQIHAYVYVFDIQQKNTLDEINSIAMWIAKREEKEAGRRESVRTLKYMAANKAEAYYMTSGDKDLKSLQKVIKQIEKKQNHKATFEVSALENKGIEEMFGDIARSVIDENIVKEDIEEEDDDDQAGRSANSFGARLAGWCGCGGRDKPQEDEDIENDEDDASDGEEAPPTSKKKESKCILM